MSNKAGPYVAVKKLLAANPACSNAELRRTLPRFTVTQIGQAAWQCRNAERKRQTDTRYYRKIGQRPIAAMRAEQRAAAARLTAPALKLKATGKSFTEVGQRLGITRNAVAGRLWRARRQQEGARA